MKPNNAEDNEKRLMRETIRDRPLPTPPLYDTMASNLTNDSNLKESRYIVDNMFKSQRRDASNSLIEDSKVLRLDKSNNSANDLSKEALGVYLMEFGSLLGKINNRLDSLERNIHTLANKIDEYEIQHATDDKERSVQLEKELKKEAEKFITTQKEYDEATKENTALKTDKQILMDLVKKMVENNENNLEVINTEFYNSKDAMN